MLNKKRSRRNRKISLEKTQEELTFEKKRMEALFKHSMDGIALLDAQDRIIDINKSFTDLFGHHIEEIRGQHIDNILPGTVKFKEAKELTERVLNGEAVAIESIRLRKDGTEVQVSVKGVPILIEDKIMGIFSIYTDITIRKEYEERLKYLGMCDSLTGLYNRAFFEENINRLDTERQLPLSIVIADINGLKLLNDAFGHAMGDKLLVEISKILKNVCRNEDIVCRFGGDEFAMIFPKTSEVTAQNIISRIREACQSEKIQSIPLSISLGVACKTDFSQYIQKIIREAEDRMYRNKLLDSKNSRTAIINALQKSLHEKTHETVAHSERMKKFALQLGKKLRLSDSDMEELTLLCSLHDIGKVAIPDHILTKSEALTQDEWEIIKKHPEIGYRIAMATPELMNIAKKILAHHERWDGNGYPEKLRQEEIPLVTRIITLVDAYDVMTNGRPYKKRLSIQEAINEVLRCSGTQFDPNLVELFLETLSDYNT